MPDATIASAMSRINFSFTSQAKVFQLFQPSGGVWPSCSNFWADALAPNAIASNAMESSVVVLINRSINLSSIVVLEALVIIK